MLDGPDQVDGPDAMPPATIQLTERGYRHARLTIASKENYLYEGVLTVRAVINGVEKTYQIGSTEQPSPTPLDWNIAKRQWSDTP
ncbi:hypothetical protein DMB66_43555 [Actinoplanes sp. ATCC 53533]|nr:hypothetical protein DMB66_43555 [Actinoplanes sp. ATCC 53533]